MDDGDWLDATAVGSRYEQQYEMRYGQWRHRLAGSPREPRRFPEIDDRLVADYPWQYGPAPDMK